MWNWKHWGRERWERYLFGFWMIASNSSNCYFIIPLHSFPITTLSVSARATTKRGLLRNFILALLLLILLNDGKAKKLCPFPFKLEIFSQGECYHSHIAYLYFGLQKFTMKRCCQLVFSWFWQPKSYSATMNIFGTWMGDRITYNKRRIFLAFYLVIVWLQIMFPSPKVLKEGKQHCLVKLAEDQNLNW